MAQRFAFEMVHERQVERPCGAADARRGLRVDLGGERTLEAGNPRNQLRQDLLRVESGRNTGCSIRHSRESACPDNNVRFDLQMTAVFGG
jgi:hypothetical protein